MVENGRQEVPRWPPIINRKLNKVTLFPHLTRTKFLRNSYSTYFDEICAKEKLDLIGVENFYIPYEWKLNVCILVLERLENFHWFFYRKKMDKNLTEVEIDRFWEFLNSRIVKIWLEFLFEEGSYFAKGWMRKSKGCMFLGNWWSADRIIPSKLQTIAGGDNSSFS